MRLLCGGPSARYRSSSGSSSWQRSRRQVIRSLSILDFTRVKELCLYKVAGLGADVLSELIACCPVWKPLEMHHANPWLDLYRRETALRDPRKALAGLSTWQDTDDSVAAWLLGAAQTARGV